MTANDSNPAGVKKSGTAFEYVDAPAPAVRTPAQFEAALQDLEHAAKQAGLSSDELAEVYSSRTRVTAAEANLESGEDPAVKEHGFEAFDRYMARLDAAVTYAEVCELSTRAVIGGIERKAGELRVEHRTVKGTMDSGDDTIDTLDECRAELEAVLARARDGGLDSDCVSSHLQYLRDELVARGRIPNRLCRLRDDADDDRTLGEDL